MVKTIDVTRALSIDGWMSETELVWLAQSAIEHRCIVEIGSHLGRSTRALLDHTDGVVYACDNWRGPVEAYYSKEEKDQFFDRFIVNVSDDTTWNKLMVVVGDHGQLNLDVQPDMVFLDGRHEYDGVKDDILRWKDKVVPGGLLCGHDIDFPGVEQAVLELLGEDRVEVVDDTKIWWMEV